MLLAICLGAPLVLLPIINLFTVRMLWDLHNSYLGRAYMWLPFRPDHPANMTA